MLFGTHDLTPAKREQAYRTAWANIRDWLTAMLALLDTGMVKAEEIFLPYMLNSHGQTYFEALEQRHFRLEAGGEPEEAEDVIHGGQRPPLDPTPHMDSSTDDHNR